MSYLGFTGDDGDTGRAPRPRAKPLRASAPAVRGPRTHLTPPCRECRYPLLPGERTCPRCGAQVAL